MNAQGKQRQSQGSDIRTSSAQWQKGRRGFGKIQKRDKGHSKDHVDGVEMTTSHALVARLFQTALDPTAKSFIEAQKMIYRMLGQDLTADDKKKIKNMLKLQEKEIELTQKKIENADF